MRSAMMMVLMVLLVSSCCRGDGAGPTMQQGQASASVPDANAPNFQFNDLRNPHAQNYFIIGLDDGIRELTKGGDPHFNVPSFSGAGNLHFGLPYKTLIGTSDAQCLNYTGTLPNGATLTLQFCVTAGNTTINFGSKTIEIPASALKFTLEVDNWPFASPSNILQIGTFMRLRDGEGGQLHDTETNDKRRDAGNGNGATNGNNNNGNGNGTRLPPPGVDEHQEHVSFDLLEGTGLFSYPLYAILDGVERNITISSSLVGNTLNFLFDFPSFNSTLVYDPVASFSGTVSTTTSDAITFAASNVFLVFIFAFMSLFFGW